MKRIYIQWVTVQQLLFGMVMLAAKQHSVFGTQSREFNEYEGVSLCLQCTACWINPTEIAQPEPRNQNITNASFHDFLKPFSTITVSCIFSRETSVKANQKRTHEKDSACGMRQIQSAFRRAHDTEPNSSVVKCLSNHTLSMAELQNVTTLHYSLSLLGKKVIARRQSDKWRLPKKGAPKVPLWLVVAFPSKWKWL